MTADQDEELARLIALSKDSSKRGRRQLFSNISDLFLHDKERLSEQEQALIIGIMTKLLSEIETTIRQNLAEELAGLEDVPHGLITLLANDEIEVARPILFKSHLLAEPDLVEIIQNRSKEHLLAIAERDDLNAVVSDLLISHGDEDVISHLIENGDAKISRKSMEYLVEESRRIDRFQEPLIARHDIPSDLAHKMFWWVSAALRRHILEHFEIDELELNEKIVAAAKTEYRFDIAENSSNADKLVAELVKRKELNEKFLVQALRGRQIRLFLIGLAELSGLGYEKISRFIYDPNAEALIVVLKALEFSRSGFSTIYLLTRNISVSAKAQNTTKPEEVEIIMKFYDKVSTKNAQVTLRFWQLERDYLDVIDKLDNDLDDDDRVYL
ncbi:DUF2336 domain-containing protein [uncultured Sneathiella sp.]|jgi:uncharacterized protein (DUF2336 family)|uniref:DUF2336 domain-containing protein n=1 Tax=uncultured Sneathiella sp. TaxID=879315 RepID=UPI0030DBAA43|tara:strand:- start:471 stop:1625 length:1155 start_codon:yes stop_codon:yes gene_type:complete